MSVTTLTHTLLLTPFFLLYTASFIFLPGYYLSSRLHLNRLETISLALVIGVSLYSLLVYLVRFFNLPFITTELLFLLAFLLLRPSYRLQPRLPRRLSPSQIIFVSLALVSALIHAAVLLRSGDTTPLGLKLVDLSFHDSTQHLSIIKHLYTSFQVTHPGFAGAELTNYHYLIDLTLASLTRMLPSTLLHVYYRLYPLSISLLFSLSVFTFTRRLTQSQTAANAAVIFSLFAANASYYVQFFRGPEFSWGANTFMINPLIDLLQNPASIFVLSQFLAVILLTHQFPTRKRSIPFFISAIAIIAGTMIGFKAWGGLIINASLLLAGFWYLVRSRSPHLLFASLVSLIITAILFLPHYTPQTSASPVWVPGWILERMVNDADRWNYLDDIFKKQHYLQTHNTKRLFLLNGQWTLIYIFGNFFTRLLGLGAIFAFVKTPLRLRPHHLLILSATLFSLLLPLLFNQGRMAYDIEQFAPYGLLLASIFTIILLHRLIIHLVSPSNRLFASILVFTVLIFLSAPSNWTSIKARTTGTTSTIPWSELQAYTAVTQLTPSNSTILLSPSHRNIATLEFAAFTNRNTFYSGRTLSIITGEDYQTRQQQLDQLFNHAAPHEQDEFIRDHHLDYLFLYQDDLSNYPRINRFSHPIFSNSSGELYRLQLQ